MHSIRDVHKDIFLKARSEKKYETVKTMFYDFIDNSLKIFTVVVVAELLRRLFVVFRELNFYSNHYEVEERLWTIISRSFSINTGTMVILFLYVVVFLVRFAMTKDFILPPGYWFTFISLYWLFMTCNAHYSGISNAEWIREPHGIDYASGMASNYFHGYLKLTLPGDLGIKKRIELYEEIETVKFAVKRLVILIPNTMFIKGQFQSKYLTKEGVAPLDIVYKHRAGVNRPFKNDIYKFTIPINNTIYYVALEGATPMLSFFEAMNFKPSTTKAIYEMKREILLKFYKHLNKLLKEWPETEDEAELVFYNAYKADKSPQDVGEVLLTHFTNMWNEGRE